MGVPNVQGLEEGRIARNSIVLYALLVLTVALGLLAQTATNTVIPVMASEFGIGLDLAQWVASIYLLGSGIVVPIAAYWSHKLHVRTHALIGMAMLCAGALLDYIAPDIWVMLLGRTMQAFGIGVVMPPMQAVAITRFPHGRQATAMGIAGIALGVCPNLGPTVCGALDGIWGWRSFFLVLAAASAVLFVCMFFLVKEDDIPNKDMRFDTLSFVQAAVALGGLLLGLSNVSSFGIASIYVWLPLAVGVVMLAVFLRRQRTLDEPLINLRIFESGQFTHGQIIVGLLHASFVGVTLVIPLFVENVQGGTSLQAGLVLLPATIVAIAVNPIAGILTDKLGARPVTLFSASSLFLGACLWLLIDEATPLWMLMAYQTIRAVGISGLIGPATSWSLMGLAGPFVPDGSSVSAIVRQVAAALGTALMVLAIEAGTAWAVSISALSLPYQLAFGVSALLALFTLVHVIRHVR